MSKREQHRRQQLARAIALGLIITAASTGALGAAEAAIITEGVNVIGISEVNGTVKSVSDADYLSVTATGGYGFGIYAEGGTAANPSTNIVDLGQYISVKATGVGGIAEGITAVGNGYNDVTIGGSLTVEATGVNGAATGVSAINNSTSKLTNAGDIVITGSSASTGIIATKDSVITVAMKNYGTDKADLTVRVGTVNGAGKYTAGSGDAAGITTSTTADTGCTTTVTGLHNTLVQTGVGNATGINTANSNTTRVNDVEGNTATGSLTVKTNDGVARGIITVNGIAADKLSTTTVRGLTAIDVSGTYGAAGVEANVYATNTIAMAGTEADITAKATSGSAVAVHATGNKDTKNVITGVRNIKADGIVAWGIMAEDGGADNKVTATGTLTATASSGYAYGIGALGGIASDHSTNTVTLGGDMQVSTSAVDTTAEGIVALAYGDNTVNGVENIMVTASKDGNVGGNAYGISAVNNSTNSVNVDEEGKPITTAMGKLTVKSTGEHESIGIIANSASSNTVGGLTGIEASAKNSASGVVANLNATNTVAMAGDEADITATATDGIASAVTASGTAAKNVITGVRNIKADGDRADGIIAQQGADNEVTATGTLTATADNDNAAGIYAFYGTTDNHSTNTVALGGDMQVSAGDTDRSARGIGAETYGDNKVNGARNITVTAGTDVTAGGSAYGIVAFDHGTNSVNVDEAGQPITSARGKLTVKSTGESESIGIFAAGASSNTVGGLTGIEVSSKGVATGVVAFNSSVNTVAMAGTEADITATATDGSATAVSASGAASKNVITGVRNIKADGDMANGVFASDGADNEVTATGSLTATADKGSAVGIFASGGTTDNHATNIVTLGGDLQVSISAAEYIADGIVATIYGANTVNGVKNITVEATNAASGVARGIGTGDNSTNTVHVNNGLLKVTSKKGEASGIETTRASTTFVDGLTGISVTGNTATHGVMTNDGSVTTVELTGDISAISSGGEAVAISANGGTTNVTGVGAEASEVSASGATMSALLGVEKAGTINVTNVKGVVESDKATDYAISAVYSGGNVNLVNSDLGGNAIYSAANAVEGETNELSISLDKDSSLQGAVNVTNDDDKVKKAKINLTNLGEWTVTADSDMCGTLSNNNSIMRFDEGTDQHFSQVKVENLVSNNSLYYMNVNLRQGDSDKIIVSNTVSGTGGQIILNDLDTIGAGYRARLSGDLISAVNGLGDGMDYKVVNNGDNKFVSGAWEYGLAKEDDGSGYYLKTTGVSANAKTAVGNLVTPDIWYTENDALYGQLDNFAASRKDKDIWVRATHSKYSNSGLGSYAQFGGAQDMDTTFNGVSMGIDRQVKSDAKGTLWAGLLTGYGTGSNSYSGGDTDLKSLHVGIYSVYKAASGWYLSGIMKYNRYNSEGRTSKYSYIGTDYDVSDYSQNGYGLSLLLGKKIEHDKGWFVEPQFELGYHKMNSASYSLGDMPVDVDGLTSKRARAGIGFGKTKLYANGNQLTLGLSASIVHEFDGKGQITLYNNSGNTFENDYGGTWGQYRVNVGLVQPNGFNLNLGLGYNKGGHRSSPLNYSLSAMWSF